MSAINKYINYPARAGHSIELQNTGRDFQFVDALEEVKRHTSAEPDNGFFEVEVTNVGDNQCKCELWQQFDERSKPSRLAKVTATIKRKGEKTKFGVDCVRAFRGKPEYVLLLLQQIQAEAFEFKVTLVFRVK